MERGYVLHHRPYRESSVIVNLLVDGIGRVDAIARLGSGKRSIKSILQPFQPLIFQLSGKGELKTLYQVEAASPAIPLQGDGMYAGIYLNELIVRCLPVHQAAERLFLPYHQALISLASQLEQAKLRYFEQALLHELGCMPSLDKDVQGDAISSHAFYRLIPEEGFVCVVLSPQSRAGAGIYSGEALMALGEQALTDSHYSQIKHLMRTLLAPILGTKPLNSRRLFAARGDSSLSS